MTEKAMHRAAQRAAEELLNIVESALHPCVHRDFFEEAYHLCYRLIEATRRQCGRERVWARPSNN